MSCVQCGNKTAGSDLCDKCAETYQEQEYLAQQEQAEVEPIAEEEAEEQAKWEAGERARMEADNQ